MEFPWVLWSSFGRAGGPKFCGIITVVGSVSIEKSEFSDKYLRPPFRMFALRTLCGRLHKECSRPDALQQFRCPVEQVLACGAVGNPRRSIGNARGLLAEARQFRQALASAGEVFLQSVQLTRQKFRIDSFRHGGQRMPRLSSGRLVFQHAVD